jgi:hypothetical protein
MPVHPATPASLRWHAIFADQPGNAVEVAPPGDLLARFDIAALLGRYGRRPVKAMWIIDQATDEVLRVHGAVPRAIAERYFRSAKNEPPAPSLSLQQPPRTRRRRPF